MKNQIDPNELKPAKEWLKYLPEPIRTEALEACEKWPARPDEMCIFKNCVNGAIFWESSGSTGKWHKVHAKLLSHEITPVQPEEVKEIRTESEKIKEMPTKAETEIQILAKEFTTHA